MPKKPNKKQNKNWYLYMIISHKGKIYTGITTEIERRYSEHQVGMGAKFFRSDSPRELIYVEGTFGHSDALKKELQIKKLTHSQKLRFVYS